MSGGQDRHYELVVVVNPEFTDLVAEMTQGYRNSIEEGGGVVTRAEDWGRRNFAYQIGNHVKGHFVLLNFSCNDNALVEQLQDTLDNDDPVLRTLLTRTDKPATEPSPIMVALEEKAEREQEKVGA